MEKEKFQLKKTLEREITKQLQAKAMYLAGWHNLEKISEVLKVPIETLEAWRTGFGWDREKPYFEEALTKRNDAILLESIAQMNARHLKMLHKIQKLASKSLDKIEEADVVLSPAEIAKFIEIGIKSERLIRGQATDRKEIIGIVKQNMQTVREIILDVLQSLHNAGHITETGMKLFATEFVKRLNETEIKTELPPVKEVEAEIKETKDVAK
ncbi:MAG: hypothetical protein DRJ64_05080 [Thermoprotei archaeon]|nr:MAG: hypothetical protein DRJ64_05080 [Thermoprotei archaeon]